jgi:hypothetical protein
MFRSNVMLTWMPENVKRENEKEETIKQTKKISEN